MALPRRLRKAEQIEACRTVGVSDLTILDHPDGMLEYSLELRRDIARVIRTFRPDAVLTANFEVEAYGSLNQADHRVAGLVTVDAVRDADNAWVQRELAAEGLEKWHTSAILIAGHPQPTHAVSVREEDVASSVASLYCHRAYLDHVTDHPEPSEFIPEVLRNGGAAAGVAHAVTLRVH